MNADIALSYYDKLPKQRARIAEAISRMVQCGGRVEFSMYADCSDEGTGEIETSLRCVNCGQTAHAITMDSEKARQWVQQQLDAMA